MRRLAAKSAAVALALSVGACGPKNFDNENDRLRMEVVELTQRIADLEGEVAELRVKLTEAELAADRPMPAEIRDALPRVATLRVLDPITDGANPGALDARVRPLDARGRVVQMVGSLTVELVALPAAGSVQDPETLGTRTLTPSEVRDAYRVGFGQPSYWVRFDRVAPAATTLVRVRFEDALTGATHEADLVWDSSAD